MRSARDEIVSFVKVLVKHPESVRVTQSTGTPVIFEIWVHKDDLADIRSMEIAIRAVCPERECQFKFSEV
jgi:hypothetical protein